MSIDCKEFLEILLVHRINFKSNGENINRFFNVAILTIS